MEVMEPVVETWTGLLSLDHSASTYPPHMVLRAARSLLTSCVHYQSFIWLSDFVLAAVAEAACL